MYDLLSVQSMSIERPCEGMFGERVSLRIPWERRAIWGHEIDQTRKALQEFLVPASPARKGKAAC